MIKKNGKLAACLTRRAIEPLFVVDIFDCRMNIISLVPSFKWRIFLRILVDSRYFSHLLKMF